MAEDFAAHMKQAEQDLLAAQKERAGTTEVSSDSEGHTGPDKSSDEEEEEEEDSKVCIRVPFCVFCSV